MRDTVLERRENPRDDIISMLWQVEIDGRPTTLEDIENYGVLLFIAGLDTVMQGMGHGVRHLAQDSALQDELRERSVAGGAKRPRNCCAAIALPCRRAGSTGTWCSTVWK